MIPRVLQLLLIVALAAGIAAELRRRERWPWWAVVLVFVGLVAVLAMVPLTHEPMI